MTEAKDGVKRLYSEIEKCTGAVGGYSHGPVYGEITMGTFQKVVDFLRENLDFGPDSSFLDIGAGLGKPNLHVALDPGVKYSVGIEIAELRWQLSMYNLRHCLKNVPTFKEKKPSLYFVHNDATILESLDPFSHIYMFNTGFPPLVMLKLANAFNVSRTVRALVCFSKPNVVIKKHSFAVELIGKIPTRMKGSSEGHTAYVYASTRSMTALSLKRTIITSPDKEANAETPPSKRHSSRKLRTPITVQPTLDFVKGKELFADKEGVHQVIAEGMNLLKQELGDSVKYEQWLKETGLMDPPGQRKRRKVMKL